MLPLAENHMPEASLAEFSHLKMRQITKNFGSLQACANVNLTVQKGEILALLGENGAGKTSLMKILHGLLTPDSGHIYYNDQELQITSPQIARKLGIGMVHQHFMLVPNLTVTENIALGLSKSFKLNLAVVRQEILHLANIYGLSIQPDAQIWQLSVGEQQRVELLKALSLGAKILILDEPTATLTPQETQAFLNLLQKLAKTGCAIIFISHKLAEVRQISHTIQVMRQGQSVFYGCTQDVSPKELAEYMAGHITGKTEQMASKTYSQNPLDSKEHLESESKTRISNPQPKSKPAAQKSPNSRQPVLEIKHLFARNHQKQWAIQNLNLSLHSGEILGLAGVAGNGQHELAGAITGLQPAHSGEIWLQQRNITPLKPKQIMNLIGYIPEDRQHEGSIAQFSISANLILKDYNRKPFSKLGWLLPKAINNFAQTIIKDFNIKTHSLDTPCALLSGGNLQKVIVARELSRSPSVLLAMYPTRGLDLGAKAYVHEQLLKISKQGTAILLISEDLEDLLLCQRLAVIYAGKITHNLETAHLEAPALSLLMAGLETSTEGTNPIAESTGLIHTESIVASTPAPAPISTPAPAPIPTPAPTPNPPNTGDLGQTSNWVQI